MIRTLRSTLTQVPILGLVALAAWFVLFAVGSPRPRCSVAQAELKGPVILSGRLFSPTLRTGPDGREGLAAWQAWATKAPDPKSSFALQSQYRMTASRVSGLTLRGGTASIDVSPEFFPERHQRGRVWIAYVLPLPKRHLEVETSPVSPSTRKAEWFWVDTQLTINQGATVEIAGCLNGAQLRPCNDGFDALAVGRIDSEWVERMPRLRPRAPLLLSLLGINMLGLFGAVCLLLARGGRRRLRFDPADYAVWGKVK